MDWRASGPASRVVLPASDCWSRAASLARFHNMNATVLVCSLLALSLALGAAAWCAFRARPNASMPRPRRARAAVAAAALAVAAFAALLLRPHEDTFTALDHSGYRLMAAAFRAGRPFHDTDHLLLETPPVLRNAFMLLPTMGERNTRDRSFLIRSLWDARTEPFFYPILPLCAAGLDVLAPVVQGLDIFVPLLGLVFFAAFAGVGAARGGAAGVVAAAALALGSPLPAWIFRGFYAEAAGGALLALSSLAFCSRDPRAAVPGAFAASLSACFHPALLPPAAALVAFHAVAARGAG